jgi:hypothetical protein
LYGIDTTNAALFGTDALLDCRIPVSGVSKQIKQTAFPRHHIG